MTFTPYSNTTPRLVPGVQITVSDLALEDSDERLFPASKNRSARIRKKLLKRFGGEFRKVPCVWRMGGKIIMHPAIYAEMQRTMAGRVNKQIEDAVLVAITGVQP